MSALGQKQASEHDWIMSALPPIADMDQHGRDVRFVSKADIHAAVGVPGKVLKLVGHALPVTNSPANIR